MDAREGLMSCLNDALTDKSCHGSGNFLARFMNPATKRRLRTCFCSAFVAVGGGRRTRATADSRASFLKVPSVPELRSR
eukprot:s7202_g5.t1